MKKTLSAALTAAFVLGVTSTTFAADDSWRMEDNPFRDVDKGHWAYRAIEDLRLAGIVNGYGDGYFLGEKTITRYEMAQIVAKALANFENYQNVTNTGARNSKSAMKADLDRLAAEFRDELDALGVRVAELEKHSDKVIWKGKIEYTYENVRTDPNNTGHKHKDTSNGYIFRFEPTAEVNDHWTVNARIDAEGDMKDDTTTDFGLKRAWAEGDYDKFNLKVGKFEFYPEGEFGLLWDTEISGGALAFGSKWQLSALGGRISDDGVGGGAYGENLSEDDPSSVVGVRVDYSQGDKGLFGGAGWYLIKDDDFRNAIFENDDGEEFTAPNYAYSNSGKENKANIWTVNLGYKFSELLALKGAYAQNTKADFEDKSWHAELDYGNYDDASEKGQWSVYGGYRKYGTNVSFAPTEDDTLRGTRGWVVGASWAPLKNIGFQAKYFNGKYITAADGGKGKAEKIFGRVEFFF